MLIGMRIVRPRPQRHRNRNNKQRAQSPKSHLPRRAPRPQLQTDPNWGETAKQITPDKKGVHLIVDVGGLATLPQPVKAVRPEGLISITGILGGGSEDAVQKATLLECLVNACVVRGVVLGTREQVEEMNRFIEERRVRPAVDERIWGFGDVREAYGVMKGQERFSKICVRIVE